VVGPGAALIATQLFFALLPARVGLHSLALTRPHGRAGAQRMQEPPGALRDLVDGGLERRDVRCRRLCQAAIPSGRLRLRTAASATR